MPRRTVRDASPHDCSEDSGAFSREQAEAPGHEGRRPRSVSGVRPTRSETLFSVVRANPLHRVLLVSTDKRAVKAFADALIATGISLHVACDLHAGLGLAEDNRSAQPGYDLIILDGSLAAAHGLDVGRVRRKFTGIEADTGRVCRVLLHSSEATDGSHVLPQSSSEASRFLVEMMSGSSFTRAFCRGHGLSSVQTDIVELMSEGLTAKEIARELKCATTTVRSQMDRIAQKTGCRTPLAVLVALLRWQRIVACR